MGKVSEYSVETVSDDVRDWRLQVSPSSSSSSGTGAGKAKAQWYRERILSEQDEIVDRLMDARSGQEVWTSHRPVRGWYLHLRSPVLPPDLAISLQPVRNTEYTGTTPLSMSVATRLDHSRLHSVESFIPTDQARSPVHKTEDSDDQFTAVSLNPSEYPCSNSTTTASRGVDRDALSSTHARTSSRNLDAGHVRRRSAGVQPASTPVQSRNVSKSSQTDVVREEEEGEREEGRDLDSQPRVCHFLLRDGPQPGGPLAKVSWPRWAWSRVPEQVRNPLSPDGSKTFTLFWLDPPRPQQAGSMTAQAVEVLRFEDDTPWWSWKGKRRGKILLQDEAIRALCLDLGFWMALALAYLEFLEERDGYHAAQDG